MLHQKHEVQASKCCKSFPCRIQVSALLCTLKNKVFVHRAFLIKQRIFLVMVMVSMRLRGEPKGESHYIQKNCNIRNTESILHIIFLMSGVQTQFSRGKSSAYRLKQLQRNLLTGNLLIGRNIARTENGPGTDPHTEAAWTLLNPRCTTAPTQTPDTIKKTTF